MKITVQDSIYTLRDEYALLSPLIKTMYTSDIPIEYQDDGLYIEANAIHFDEYVKYLSGKPFNMDDDIACLFDYMGHKNELEYSPDVWGMKLHDEWIRDNMYAFKLYEDPLYDLVEVPIVNKCPISVPDGWYVAGGAALWMAGGTPKYSDFDLFTCMDKDIANNTLQFLNEEDHSDEDTYMRYLPSISGNSISYRYPLESDYSNVKVQFILRLYKAPTEIVHGFDLDCVGVIYVDGKLYMTRRALYSLNKKMNYFDPKRASPSYVYRLIKYRARGYHIYLPLISKRNINRCKVSEHFECIRSAYLEHICEVQSDESGYITDLYNIHEDIESLSNDRLYSKEEIMKILDNATTQYISTKPHEMARYLGRSDYGDMTDQSLLLLATFYNFYVITGQSKKLDYATRKHSDTPKKKKLMKIEFNRLKWKEQNPMEQVSSTCIPTPIKDLTEWYKESNLYIA